MVGTDLALVVLVDTGLVDLVLVGRMGLVPGLVDLASVGLVLVLVGRMVTWVWGWVGLASSTAQAGALARVASLWEHLAQAAMLSARAHLVSPTTPTTTGGDRTVTGGRLCVTTCTSSNSPSWVHKATTISSAKRLGIFLGQAKFCCGLESGKSSHKK